MIGAAVLFSTGGAAIKGTGFTGVRGGLELAAWRSGVAALAVALMLPASRHGWTRRTTAVKVLSDARRGGEPTPIEAAARAAPP